MYTITTGENIQKKMVFELVKILMKDMAYSNKSENAIVSRAVNIVDLIERKCDDKFVS
jgi:hypothetical protein